MIAGAAALLLALASAEAGAEAGPRERVTRVVVHPQSAEVFRTIRQDFTEDAAQSLPRGAPATRAVHFVVALAPAPPPDVDLATVRVRPLGAGSVVHEWSVVEGRDGTRFLQAVVGVTAAEHAFEVAWVTSRASWKPEHRIELDTESGALTVTTTAVVAQATGETWTAPIAFGSGTSAELGGGIDAASLDGATVTVPGDGTERRIALPPLVVPARRIVHVDASDPASASAFAVVALPRDLPGGPAFVLVDGAWRGLTVLPSLARGAEWRVPLGPEPSVVVVPWPGARRRTRVHVVNHGLRPADVELAHGPPADARREGCVTALALGPGERRDVRLRCGAPGGR